MRVLRSAGLIITTGGAVLVAGCSGGGDKGGGATTSPPPVSTPAQIQITSGAQVTGVAGSPLSGPLVIKVVDKNGAAYSGAAVTWAVTAGGGTISPASTTTDASGQASATWTLGTLVGSQTATATVSGVTPVTFTAVASAPGPLPVQRVTVTPDSARFASVGDTARFRGTAFDANGVAVGSAQITWSTSDATVATVDGSGLVTAVKNGTATITAAAQGKSATAAVRVSQVASTLAVTGLPANAQAGDTVTLTATVTDARGTPVPGVAITFDVTAGGGTLSALAASVAAAARIGSTAATSAVPTAVTTNAQGVAKVRWILGSTAGSNTVSVSAVGIAAPRTPSVTTTPRNGGSGGGSGTLAFNYTGGAFNASGALTYGASGVIPYGTWAAALPTQPNVVSLTAVQALGGTAAAGFSVTIGGATGPVTMPICPLTPGACQGATVAATFGSFVIGTWVASSNTVDNPGAATSYLFTGGTLTVTSLTATRMTGTFSGTAQSVGTGAVITITNGTFDVPIITPPK